MHIAIIVLSIYGFIDFFSWFGLKLSASLESLVTIAIGLVVLITYGLLKGSVFTGGFATVGLLLLLASIFLFEIVSSIFYDSSLIVASYCIVSIVLLIMLRQYATTDNPIKIFFSLYVFLGVVQALILLLAVVDFDYFSTFAIGMSEGIDKKIDVYGSLNIDAYRKVGPFFFSSITENPIFGAFGVVGFSREPHISFTLMLMLLSMSLSLYKSFGVKLFLTILFLPSLTYLSKSNIIAIFTCLLITVLLSYVMLNRPAKIAGISISVFILIVFFVNKQYILFSIIEHSFSDRSLIESVQNVQRLITPSFGGSGLSDIVDRDNSSPSSLGAAPFFLYFLYLFVVVRAYFILRDSGYNFLSFSILYFCIYSMKSPTVILFLPILIASLSIALLLEESRRHSVRVRFA